MPRFVERLEEAIKGHFSYGSCSIDYVGVAHATPEDHSVADLLKRADAAMYEVKRLSKAPQACDTQRRDCSIAADHRSK